MNSLEVNVERFRGLFPAAFREQTAEYVRQAIGERADVNREFFGRMHEYHRQPFYDERLRIPDLYSPNICAIDFAVDHLRDDLILDWGCGLGVCGSYLRRSGFEAFGHDDWSQLPREVADDFQKRMEYPLPFVQPGEISPSVVMHVSIWAPPVGDSVRWVLSDTHYVRREADPFPGFSRWGFYDSTLTIFQRD